VIQAEKPDVLLMDLELPAEGNDLTRVANFICDLRRTQPDLTILVHSAKDKIRIDVVRAMVGAGVSYLIKEDVESPEHLERAIWHARKGGVIYDHYIVQHLAKVAEGKAPSLLTSREWQVAALVAEHLSNKEIAQILHLSPARVSELVTSILNKLGVSRRSQIVTWYRDNPPPMSQGIGSSHS
jgi:DNA-binding NarL/FixJ family response regulator